MFKDFDISSYKKMKPPSDNSFDTMQEVKALKNSIRNLNYAMHVNAKDYLKQKIAISNDRLNPKLMELIEESEKAGSLCTRIMGAGGGGFFVCWAPEYRHQAIKDRVNVKTWVKVKISSSGSQIIYSE